MGFSFHRRAELERSLTPTGSWTGNTQQYADCGSTSNIDLKLAYTKIMYWTVGNAQTFSVVEPAKSAMTGGRDSAGFQVAPPN